MKHLTLDEIQPISGGTENTCQVATVALLQACQWHELQNINNIFKNIILAEREKGSNSEEIRAALIESIQNTEF